MAEELRKQLGIDYTPDKRSAWYMLMFPIARLLREKEERQQYQADKMNLFKCEGQEIDDMLAGSPFYFQRKQESKATVDIKLIGGTGVQLFIGDVIVEAKDGTTYRLAEEKVLNTETSFLFECETSGSIGNKLFCIPKILKNESNSQLKCFVTVFSDSCFVSQRY